MERSTGPCSFLRAPADHTTTISIIAGKVSLQPRCIDKPPIHFTYTGRNGPKSPKADVASKEENILQLCSIICRAREGRGAQKCS